MHSDEIAMNVKCAWLDIVKHLAHHPRTETVPLPSGCSLVPNKYTRLQRSFLDLVEAARHLRQAARCLRWSWLGVRAAVRDSAIWRVARRLYVAGLRQKEGCNASCDTTKVPANRASGACADVGTAPARASGSGMTADYMRRKEDAKKEAFAGLGC